MTTPEQDRVGRTTPNVDAAMRRLTERIMQLRLCHDPERARKIAERILEAIPVYMAAAEEPEPEIIGFGEPDEQP
jgi:hypothetical protein